MRFPFDSKVYIDDVREVQPGPSTTVVNHTSCSGPNAVRLVMSSCLSSGRIEGTLVPCASHALSNTFA